MVVFWNLVLVGMKEPIVSFPVPFRTPQSEFICGFGKHLKLSPSTYYFWKVRGWFVGERSKRA